MSNPFSTAPLTTLPQWNAILAGGCCCAMPECPEPVTTCQSASGSTTCEDGSIGQAYDEAFAAYAQALADWIAGGSVGTEPEAPESPPDGSAFSCWVQFTRPDGDDEDDVPLLYRMSQLAYPQEGQDWYTGTVGAKNSANYWNTLGTPFVYYSETSHGERTYAAQPFGTGDLVQSAWEATYDASGPTGPCQFPGGYGTTPEVNEVGSFSLLTPAGYSSTLAHVITYTGDIYQNISGTTQTPGTCPGPWGQAVGGAFLSWEWADLTLTEPGSTLTLSDTIDRAAMIAAAIDDIPAEEWPDEACAATLAVTWPAIGQFAWGITLEAIQDQHGGTSDTRDASANAAATKVRYRRAVPDTHLGTWYRALWDIIEEPTGWDATIDDPEYVPPEEEPEGGWPPVPQIPDLDAPVRTYHETDLEFLWEGDPFDPEADPPDETRISDWFQIAPPEVPGERRPVNLRAWSYRGPFGTLPTLFGEQIARLDAELDGEPVTTLNLGTAALVIP